MIAPVETLIFTDGACSGNPGPGGWGAVVLAPDGSVRELGGGHPRTTNNRMELTAALEALKAAPGPAAVYTDSVYMIRGLTEWIHGWKRRGWKTAEGQDVLNRDLWEELEAAARGRRLDWRYIRGHTGCPGNERCDEIAVAFSKGKPVELYNGPVSGYPHDLLELPAQEQLPRSSAKERPPKRPGGFYISLLAGAVERHQDWRSCQERVYGKSGARFKKVFSEAEAEKTLKDWGAP